MSKTVIQAEHVWKKYRLGVIGANSLRQELEKLKKRVFKKTLPKIDAGINNHTESADSKTYIWALQDLSFSIQEGEAVGIIGKNGAGKSTLLKILSKITTPTQGRIKIRGQVASLLEVGTGMHPELTGIENVYLNGAILGMRRQEIRKKLHDIIDFAGVSKYADTPVKRYSSGMRVRLGFAVAAFLEPEILIIDEVLAVGDIEFQQKAIEKMKEIRSQQGKTILFVSHSMELVHQFCSRAMVMHQGKLAYSGDVGECINFYLQVSRPDQNLALSQRTDRKGSGEVRFTKLELMENRVPVDFFSVGGSVCIRVHYEVEKQKHVAIDNYDYAINIYDITDKLLLNFSTIVSCNSSPTITESGYFDLFIPRLPLSEGTYRLELYLAKGGHVIDHIPYAYMILVQGGSFYGTNYNNRPYWYGRLVIVEHQFLFSQQFVESQKP